MSMHVSYVRVRANLTAETVKGTSLPFQCVDDVHGGDGFPLSMFGIGDGISDDIFEEYFQNAARLLVDETGYTFHSSSTR